MRPPHSCEKHVLNTCHRDLRTTRRIPCAMSSLSARVAVVGLAAFALQCAGPRRFPLRSPVWVDNDARPMGHAPPEYWSPLIWDAADQQAFRPLTRGLILEVGHEATNVNALDEVPDSTWYNNRLTLHRMTPRQLADGPCADQPPLDPNAIWTLTAAKPNGWAPGFIARGPDGHRYLLKADGERQNEQPTGADAVGSRIYWAAGYNAPCNRTVRIPRANIHIAPDATFDDELGNHHPMTVAQLEHILTKATHYPDDSYRFGTSQFVAGRPVGPKNFQ